MTQDDLKIITALIQSSLDQSEMLSMVTKSVFQWMESQELAQVIRDKLVEEIESGNNPEESKAFRSQLAELGEKAAEFRRITNKQLLDLIARGESERDQMAGALERLKKSLESES